MIMMSDFINYHAMCVFDLLWLFTMQCNGPNPKPLELMSALQNQ
jgi:hypothetical protein